MDLKPEHHILGFVNKWVLNQVMARMLLTPLLLELVLVYHIYLLELLMPSFGTERMEARTKSAKDGSRLDPCILCGLYLCHRC